MPSSSVDQEVLNRIIKARKNKKANPTRDDLKSINAVDGERLNPKSEKKDIEKAIAFGRLMRKARK